MKSRRWATALGSDSGHCSGHCPGHCSDHCSGHCSGHCSSHCSGNDSNRIMTIFIQVTVPLSLCVGHYTQASIIIWTNSRNHNIGSKISNSDMNKCFRQHMGSRHGPRRWAVVQAFVRAIIRPLLGPLFGPLFRPLFVPMIRTVLWLFLFRLRCR